MKGLNLKNVLMLTSALVLSHGIYAAAPTLNPISADSKDIKWVDAVNLPSGAKVAILTGDPQKKEFYVARLKLPANYVVPAHSHLKNEYDTVISGTYYFGSGKKINQNEGSSLSAGGFVEFPAKMPHYGWTKEETILEISGIGPWGTIPKKLTA